MYIFFNNKRKKHNANYSKKSDSKMLDLLLQKLIFQIADAIEAVKITATQIIIIN